MNDKKNFIWNFIGVTLNAFTSFFFLIIVNRVNGIDVAGIFSYAYSIDCLFFFLSMYYSRSYQIANYNDNKNFNQFLTFRFIFCVISLFVTLMFCIINKFGTLKILIIMLIMAYRTIEAISDAIFGYLQNKDQLYKTGISFSLKAVFGILLFLVVDLILNSVIYSLLVLLFICLIILIFYDFNSLFKVYDKSNLKLDINNFRLIIKEALPIFIISFLGVYLANLQKYILTYYEADNIQAIFAIIIMPATMLSLVGNYLINPFISNLNNSVKQSDYKKFFNISKKILLSLFLIGMLGMIVCYFIGIPILNFIYDINLSDYKLGLIIIIFASILTASSMILSNLLVLLKSNNSQLLIYVFSSIIATLIGVILIKNNSINGAILSYLITYFIVFILYLFVFIKKYLELR